MSKRQYIIFFVTLLFIPFCLQAQTFEETMAKLSQIAAKKYIEPAMTGFGSNLNSGWINQVPQPKTFGFDLSIKIVGMGTFLNDKPKTFSTNGMFKFTSGQADDILANSGVSSSHPGYAAAKQELLSKEWNVNFNGPTIIGKESDRLKIVFPGGNVAGLTISPFTETVTEVKGILDELTILPTGSPQITIGTVFGTQVLFRYLPPIDIDKLGKFKFYGFGIIHNPAVWLSNPLPVDIGIGYFSQKLKIGSIAETDATQYGIFISKTIGNTIALIPYAGLTVEKSKTTINYEFEYQTVVNGTTINAKEKINFEMEGENTSAILLGATIKLSILNLNVDYKIAKYNSLSAGVSFCF